MRVTLNIDAGEHPDELGELYSLADIVNIACGGHAGDDTSMRRVLAACKQHGTRAGAHPSYADREGFGRRAQTMAPAALRSLVAAQCGRLHAHAQALGVTVAFMKPHGALYHAADASPELAHAVVCGAVDVLGAAITVIGPAHGSLAEAALAAGASFAREAFADRAVGPDGKLVARDKPGAVLTSPIEAAARATELASSPEVDTVCVHGDTARAVEIARAVREALEGARR